LEVDAMDVETTVKEFAWFCHQLCLDFGGSEQSGFRTDDHNADVRGVAASKHTWHGGWGCARDFHFDTEEGCLNAQHRVREHPRYVYRDYKNPRRLHVQAFAVGERPPVGFL
jgi:hypothetical protein